MGEPVEQHDLRVESGGCASMRFAYVWCPCGWTKDLRFSAYAEDDAKRAFRAHLAERAS